MTMIQHLCFRRQAPTYQKILLVQRSHYFTNGDRVKGDDPYAVLGLTWGATNTEIKEAYHKLAREHHPDVSKASLEKFQKIQHAYSSLMDVKIFRFSSSKEKLEQYSFQTWRLGDAIAQQRTDVAGAARKRPKPPAVSSRIRMVVRCSEGYICRMLCASALFWTETQVGLIRLVFFSTGSRRRKKRCFSLHSWTT